MNKNGLTFLEIIIVVVIFGILAAIAIPSFKRAWEESLRRQGIPIESTKELDASISLVGECPTFKVYRVYDKYVSKYFHVVLYSTPQENILEKVE